jgi:hypothetical protein
MHVKGVQMPKTYDELIERNRVRIQAREAARVQAMREERGK